MKDFFQILSQILNRISFIHYSNVIVISLLPMAFLIINLLEYISFKVYILFNGYFYHFNHISIFINTLFLLFFLFSIWFFSKQIEELLAFYNINIKNIGILQFNLCKIIIYICFANLLFLGFLYILYLTGYHDLFIMATWEYNIHFSIRVAGETLDIDKLDIDLD